LYKPLSIITSTTLLNHHHHDQNPTSNKSSQLLNHVNNITEINSIQNDLTKLTSISLNINEEAELNSLECKEIESQERKVENEKSSLTTRAPTPKNCLTPLEFPPPLPPRDLKYQNFKHKQTQNQKQTAGTNAFPPQVEVNIKSTDEDNNNDNDVLVNESPHITTKTTTPNKNNNNKEEKSIQYNDDPKTNLKIATNNDKIQNFNNNNAKTHLQTATTNPIPIPPPLSPLTHSPSGDFNKHMPLKRNNSYRLANDDLKLEMNKENHNVYNESPSPTCLPILPTPSPHQFQSLPRIKTKNSIHNDSQPKSPLTLTSTPQNSSSTPMSSGNTQQSRKIAKSFERLIDEFSLSTISIDSSYLRNKSLENFDDSPSILSPNLTQHTEDINGKQLDNEESDSETELDSLISPAIPQIKYHKSFIEAVLLKPLKIIRPTDENRKRILQKFEVTEIW
ncbi:uncharacterized protein ACRADG_012797, partial [Cochliomyia hominivorax]